MPSFWAFYLYLFLSRRARLRIVDLLPRKRLAGFEKTIHRGSSPSLSPFFLRFILWRSVQIAEGLEEQLCVLRAPGR